MAAEDCPSKLALTRRILSIPQNRFTAVGRVAANEHLRSTTIEHAGDLPQLEQADETAAVVDGILI